MPKKINLVGERFGRLLVVKESPIRKSGSKQYICKCDCGNEKLVMSYHLRSEDTKSCGCLRSDILKEYRKTPSCKAKGAAIGSRHGKLVVVSEYGDDYLCRCDCGREIICKRRSIYARKSCGCDNKTPKARRVYEEVFGQKVPENMWVIFLDNDKSNITRENMMLVSNATYVKMNREHLYYDDPELTKSAALSCELSHIVSTKSREFKDKTP